jgi:hypothetical protein
MEKEGYRGLEGWGRRETVRESEGLGKEVERE